MSPLSARLFAFRTCVLSAIPLLAVASSPSLAAVPGVVVTIKPVHSLMAGVMDGIGKPTLLFEGNEDPHSASLRPSQARSLNTADIVVRIGADLEQSLNRPLASLAADTTIINILDIPDLRIFRARKGGVWITGDLHKEHSAGVGDHSHLDPHIWLSPENAHAMALHFATTLGQIDVANAPRYLANAENLRRKINALDKNLEKTLASVRETPFMVFHDALQNFERHYKLNALGAVAVGSNRPPGARRLRQLRERITSSGTACLFTHPQFAPRLAESLVQGTTVAIAELDPLGASIKPGQDLWFELMTTLAERMGDCLSQ